MRSCQSWLVNCFFDCWLLLDFWFLLLLKACWYLHKRDWEVRSTSIGLGFFPWWRTKFLWFHIDQRVVKTDCSRPILIGLLGSFCITQFSTHWEIERFKQSEVLIPRIEPCHTALAKWHFKKRWLSVSSSSLQRIHKVETEMPLLLRTSKTGKLPWRSFQMKFKILRGSLTFQILSQASFAIPKHLWFCVAEGYWSLRSNW